MCSGSTISSKWLGIQYVLCIAIKYVMWLKSEWKKCTPKKPNIYIVTVCCHVYCKCNCVSIFAVWKWSHAVKRWHRNHGLNNSRHTLYEVSYISKVEPYIQILNIVFLILHACELYICNNADGRNDLFSVRIS